MATHWFGIRLFDTTTIFVKQQRFVNSEQRCLGSIPIDCISKSVAFARFFFELDDSARPQLFGSRDWGSDCDPTGKRGIHIGFRFFILLSLSEASVHSGSF